ncbi:unnamed protein product [Cyclocybe aegerita]|uniref:Uncharacterized protein n=1 Tax=Cyclocybe aegerita TaxID=1973307 RepID=A0A8S0VS37_CYCAE|nr:unnamed protein product [Cyclocybe aegerita]
MLTSELPPTAIAQMPAVFQLPPVRALIEEVETFLALNPDAHRTVNQNARDVTAREQQVARPLPKLKERSSPYSKRHARRLSAAKGNSLHTPNSVVMALHPVPTRREAIQVDMQRLDVSGDLASVTSLMRSIERRNSSDQQIDRALRSQICPRSPASLLAYLSGQSNSPSHVEACAYPYLQPSCFTSSNQIYESKTPIPHCPRRCSATICVSAPDESPNKLVFPSDWSHTGLDRTSICVPATDRMVYFQSTEPSEEDVGVPLFVIERFPQGMIGGKQDLSTYIDAMFLKGTCVPVRRMHHSHENCSTILPMWADHESTTRA